MALRNRAKKLTTTRPFNKRETLTVLVEARSTVAQLTPLRDRWMRRWR
ncbi:MAG: hypothetical protein M3350_05435 [Actinomycetota bacterium]|nr:hypothetical protein [Actinomycetota bacterium]